MAIAGTLALPVWLRLSRHALENADPVGTRERVPWQSPRAWAATLVFAFQAVCFFALNAWLADAMIERGWTKTGRACSWHSSTSCLWQGIVLFPSR
jgi:cyanate permease